MRNFTKLYFFLTCALGLFSTLPAQQVFEATLSGQQEVLPTATRASGNLTATLTGNTLTVEGSYQNLSSPLNAAIAGGAHLHLGLAGQNGDVAFLLTEVPDADPLSGTYLAATNTFTLTNEQVDTLNKRGMYANIHSITFGSGELRGQLLPQADEYYFVNLLGSNEVPSIISGASGALAVERVNDSLIFSGSFQNLEGAFATDIAGGAHVHVGLAGSNGDITYNLNASVNSDSRSGIFSAANNNVGELTAPGISLLENRSFYVNIHSRAFPSGELRGQIVGMAQAVFRTHLSGSNEWPVVNSRGRGQVIAELYPNDSLIVSGSFSDLGSAVNTMIAGGAHIHAAPAGLNGPIVAPITPALSADSRSGDFLAIDNRFRISSGQADTMLLRQFYVNIHSMDNGPGEIRGQLLNESQAVMTAFLSGTQEPTDVHTDARGMMKFEVSGNRLIGSGGFTDLSSTLNVAILGGAHVHAGYPGQSGPVVLPLLPELNMDSTGGVFLPSLNAYTLSDGQLDTLLDRNLYVNIHSLAHAAGEIRGAILAEATSYFLAPLSGASETNPVNTGAGGMLAMEVTGNNVVSVGSFAGLESDFNTAIAGGAHLHDNIAGSNGPVDFLLNSEIAADSRSAVFLADSNQVSLSDGQRDTLDQRRLYVNIHSMEQASGEIRGQVLPLAGDYLHTSLQGINEVQPITTTGIGGLKLELTGNVLVVTGSFSNLQGGFDASIAGGAHLHLAGPGGNGDVSVLLNATTAADTLSGYFAAADNTFTLDPDQREAIKSGNFYANIHTTAFGSGELRGQIVPEVNLFPVATTIEAPVEGASIVLEGAAETEFIATWLPAIDPDGNTVVYVWQLATDAEFNDIIFATNTGVNANFTTDFGTVDALLDGAGVMSGGMATLYHRVVASDGSNGTPGEGKSVNLTRGMLVNIDDLTPTGFSARAFPSVTQTIPVTFEVTTEEAFRGEIVLADVMGRVLFQQPQEFVSGVNRNTIDLTQLNSGTYFLFLRHRNGVVYHQRILKQ